MVGGSGFEPLTSSLSTRRAPAAPTAHHTHIGLKFVSNGIIAQECSAVKHVNSLEG